MIRRYDLTAVLVMASAVLLAGIAVQLVISQAMAQAGQPATVVAPAADVGTSFVYQGYLQQQDGLPVEGSCDFEFRLFDAAVGDTQIDGVQSRSGHAVSQGRFTAELDFGANAFDGQGRWLEIRVRCPAGSGNYATLLPRQPMTGAPYALGLRPGATVNGNVGSPAGILNLTNNGSGNGLTVNAAGGIGVAVNNAGSIGYWANAPTDHGVLVTSPGGHGFFADNPTDDGFNTFSPGGNGAVASSPAGDGFRVSNAGGTGFYASSPATRGFQVDNAGNDGFAAFSPTGVGFRVHGGLEGLTALGPTGHGVRVADAGGDGFRASSPAGDGFRVTNAGGNGFFANAPTGVGFRVDGAGNHGFLVQTAGQSGFVATSPTVDGFQVYNAGGDGFYASSPTGNGFFANAPALHGVQVNDAGNSGFVAIAPTNYAGYFEGEIVVDSCSGCAISAFGHNAGQSTLTPGDVIAVRRVMSDATLGVSALLEVELATAPHAAMGVVVGRAEVIENIEGQGAAANRLISREGSVKPGEYAHIVLVGLAQVKASSGAAPIQSGTRLTAADEAGYVRALRIKMLDDMVVTEGTSVLGIALESPKAGQDLIWVLVNPR